MNDEINLLQTETNLLKINAKPTKELFISMLVRDLSLIDAIGDLLDNSVDGARQISPSDNFNGLYINVEIYPDYFKISDNCGGISVETAINYAFTFGRSPKAPASPNSIGQFGIGMKRSLFKLGSKFNIKSKAKNSQFVLSIDVENWKNDDKWEFDFESVENEMKVDIPESERGTSIKVEILNDNVKQQFSDKLFIQQLTQKIELKNFYNIDKGLSIKINEYKLTTQKIAIISSDEFKTAFWKYDFGNNLQVEIYAGISEPDLESGGWYIFGNGRLIVGPETSSKTGWGMGSGKSGIPVYHNQFSRFRGFVFFKSQDASLLPWNTTKTDIVVDSMVYKFVKDKMIEMMRPIIDFLNNVKDERGDFLPDERVLEQMLNNAQRISIASIDTVKTATTFEHPVYQKPTILITEVKITYKKSKQNFEKVRKSLDASSAKEVGELTFDYYYDMEIDE